MEGISYIVTAASIIGTIANAYKKRWCFVVWLFTNLFWCVYDFGIGAYSQSILYLIYLVISIIGIKNWRDKDMGKGKRISMTKRLEKKDNEIECLNRLLKLKRENIRELKDRVEGLEETNKIFASFLMEMIENIGVVKINRDKIKKRLAAGLVITITESEFILKSKKEDATECLPDGNMEKCEEEMNDNG